MEFQNRVLLVADNVSDTMKDYFEECCPYAILLIGTPIVWRQREGTTYEDKTKKCSIVDRAQPCIFYQTKEDLDNNTGTYWETILDEPEEYLYEYTAKII